MNLSFLEFFEIGQSDSVESGYFLLFFPVASLNDPGNDEIPVFPQSILSKSVSQNSIRLILGIPVIKDESLFFLHCSTS